MKLPYYFDYAASTPVDPFVAGKIFSCLTEESSYGNAASSQHFYGKEAEALIQAAAQQVAEFIHAQPDEIIWTSGATESNNLAIKGIAQFYSYKGKHIITSRIEHKSILDTCRYLEKQGFELTYLSPQSNGLIEPELVANAIRQDTILVSLIHVNNEFGVEQNIKAISHIVKSFDCFFHVDAAQSLGKTKINVDCARY